MFFVKMSKKISAKNKILLIFTLLNIITTCLYSIYVYSLKSTSIANEIDSRLRAATYAVPKMLPPEYIDQAVKKDSVNIKKYNQLVHDFYVYCQKVGIKYLYVFIYEGDKIVYIMDTASDEQVEKGDYGAYFQVYDDPAPDIVQTFIDGNSRFAEYHDRFGYFRSFFWTGMRADGRRYLVGGDIEIDHVKHELNHALLTTMGIGLFIFTVGLILSWIISKSLMSPIYLLLETMKKITAGDYKARLILDREDEVKLLAEGFNNMADAIGTREQEILRLAFRDELTGLANRLNLADALSKEITGDNFGALILLDIARFRYINDHLGYSAGDSILKMIATRLSNLPLRSSIVARIGANSFALLLPNVSSSLLPPAISAIREALEAQPFLLDAQHLDVTASIGAALYPTHGKLATLVLRHAEIAMYTAKLTHQNYSIYDVSQETNRLHQLGLLTELRQAIEHNELRVFYQPQFRFDNGACVHVEALIRWEHPQKGWLPPSAFVPFAEETGRIKDITRWLLSKTFQQNARWKKEGRDIGISINISVQDVEDDTFPALISQILTETGADTRLLCLEITETELMANAEKVLANLHTLHRFGLRLAIDDFGTGYSSLAYLSRLPVDELKIDRSFVIQLENPQNHLIVSSTINLGHNLGLSIVAEGIETLDAWEQLKHLGCDYAQGYLMAKPMSIEALDTWLNTHPKGYEIPLLEQKKQKQITNRVVASDDDLPEIDIEAS